MLTRTKRWRWWWFAPWWPTMGVTWMEVMRTWDEVCGKKIVAAADEGWTLFRGMPHAPVCWVPRVADAVSPRRTRRLRVANACPQRRRQPQWRMPCRVQSNSHPNIGFQSDARNQCHFGSQAQPQHRAITTHLPFRARLKRGRSAASGT